MFLSLNLLRIHEICQDRDNLLKNLQNWCLILKEGDYKCPKCEEPLFLYDEKGRDWRWYGLNKISIRKQASKKYGFKQSIRTGTFFSKSHFSYFQILGFAHLWTEGLQLCQIKRQLDIGCDNSLVDWSSFCREVLLDAFIYNSQPIGGEGVVVEIDESKFGKRKYHRGKRVVGQWVFGGYERGTGNVFMVPVEDRGADTLMRTTIISDCLKSYNFLEREGFEHLRVNHSLHFKDPDTGAHSNSIEASWRAAKAINNPNGRKKAHIPENLARYMFNKKCLYMKLDRTIEFYRLAGQLYNPRQENNLYQEENANEDLEESMLD